MQFNLNLFRSSINFQKFVHLHINLLKICSTITTFSIQLNRYDCKDAGSRKAQTLAYRTATQRLPSAPTRIAAASGMLAALGSTPCLTKPIAQYKASDTSTVKFV